MKVRPRQVVRRRNGVVYYYIKSFDTKRQAEAYYARFEKALKRRKAWESNAKYRIMPNIERGVLVDYELFSTVNNWGARIR